MTLIKKSGNLTVVSCHSLETGYDFDWNHVRILDHKPIYSKRLISEMIYIKKSKAKPT